jgi:hypothetical protein
VAPLVGGMLRNCAPRTAPSGYQGCGIAVARERPGPFRQDSVAWYNRQFIDR